MHEKPRPSAAVDKKTMSFMTKIPQACLTFYARTQMRIVEVVTGTDAAVVLENSSPAIVLLLNKFTEFRFAGSRPMIESVLTMAEASPTNRISEPWARFVLGFA